MQDKVTLMDGTVIDWSDDPEQFRHIVDSKKAARLVRNAETVRAAFSGLGDIPVQKAGVLAALKELRQDEELVCLFNGLDLTILGVALAADEGEE